MRVEEVEQRDVAGEGRGRQPQPLRVGEARVQLHPPEPEQVELGRAVDDARRGRARRGLAHLHQQHAAGQLAREVHDDGIAVGQAGVDRGGHGRRGVHDDAGRRRRRNSPSAVEARVHGRGVAVAHEQADLVAPAAGDLGRLVRFVLGVEHEARASGPAGGGVRRLDHGYLDPAAAKALAS